MLALSRFFPAYQADANQWTRCFSFLDAYGQAGGRVVFGTDGRILDSCPIYVDFRRHKLTVVVAQQVNKTIRELHAGCPNLNNHLATLAATWPAFHNLEYELFVFFLAKHDTTDNAIRPLFALYNNITVYRITESGVCSRLI